MFQENADHLSCMDKKFQIIELDTIEFSELSKLLVPRSLVGSVVHESHQELVYALPMFMVVKNFKASDSISIRPCHSSLDAMNKANEYLQEARIKGLEVTTES